MSQSTVAGENYAAAHPTGATPPTIAPAAGPPPGAQLLQLTSGGYVAQAISVTARLGVPDALGESTRCSAELAEAVGAHASTLYRLLRAVADFGILVEADHDRFHLTPLGQLLRSDSPGSMRGWATMVGLPFHRAAWTALYDSVKTGEPAFARVHGMDLFSYLAGDPEDAAVFDAAMQAISTNFLVSIVHVYDFTRFTTIVDVGGGTGALMAAALTASPQTRGVLLDTAPVVQAARPVLDAAGIADRCRLVAGNFFDSVPTGGDLYILANILHDWDDESAARILRNCRDAMTPDARLLVVELVLPDDTRPSMAKLYDLEMLAVTPNGRHRSGAQYRSLAEAAGLHITRVVPAYMGQPASYVEATHATTDDHFQEAR